MTFILLFSLYTLRVTLYAAINRSLTVSHHVSCNDCSLSPICLPLAVAPAQLDQLDRIIHRGRPLKRGEHLFRATDGFDSVYAVRSGALKTLSLIHI